MIRIQRASADALFDLRELLLHLEPLTVHFGRVGDEGKSARIGLLDDPQDLRKAVAAGNGDNDRLSPRA